MSGSAALEGARQGLGRGILLGLEFFVAADIIHTVAVDLSLQTVAILAVIVLIRTFLSFTLHVELNGLWPWQMRPSTPSERATEPRRCAPFSLPRRSWPRSATSAPTGADDQGKVRPVVLAWTILRPQSRTILQTGSAPITWIVRKAELTDSGAAQTLRPPPALNHYRSTAHSGP